MTRLMVYTCEVQCWDKVTRIFEHTGYFDSTDTLRHCLARWNGQPGPAGTPYRYFETQAQVRHNDGSCCIQEDLVPWNTGHWYGRQQHDHCMGTAQRIPA